MKVAPHACLLIFAMFASGAHAQDAKPIAPAGPQVRTIYARVLQVTQIGDRVQFTASPAPSATGCKQLTFYTDANGPKKNLTSLRIDQAKSSGSIMRLTFMPEPANCQAYVVEADPQ